MILKRELGNTSLSLIFAEMEEVRRSLLREIKDLTQEQLDYSPDINKFETIGTMIFHIVDVENSWIFEHIDKEELDFEKWKYAFPLTLRKKLTPRQEIGKPLSHYLNLLSEYREKTRKRIAKFHEEGASEIHTSKMGKTSVEWVLFHIQRHESHHTGQINLVKRLYKLHYS